MKNQTEKINALNQEKERLEIGGRKCIISKAIFDKYDNIVSINGIYKWAIGEVEFNRTYTYVRKKLARIVENFTDFSGVKIQTVYDEAYNKISEKMIFANSYSYRLFDSIGRVIKFKDHFGNGELKTSISIRYDDANNYMDVIVEYIKYGLRYNKVCKGLDMGNIDNEKYLISEDIYHNDIHITNIKYNSDGYDKIIKYIKTGTKCYINSTSETYYDSHGNKSKQIIINKAAHGRPIVTKVCYIGDDLRWECEEDIDIGYTKITKYYDDKTVETIVSSPINPQKDSQLNKIVNVYDDNDYIIEFKIYKYKYNGHRYRIMEKSINNDEEKTTISYNFIKANKQIVKTTSKLDIESGVESIITEVIDKFGNVISCNDVSSDSVIINGKEYTQEYIDDMCIYNEK